MNDLVISETVTAVQVYGSQNSVDDMIKKIREKVDAFKPDISTAKGRDEIRSFARKLASSKTALDNMGKDLKADYKAKCDAIDAERRKLWEAVEAMQHEVRQPLTEFETREKVRIDAHEKALQDLASFKNYIHGDENGQRTTADRFEQILLMSRELHAGRNWEEFAQRANEQAESNETALTAALDERRKYDTEQAELKRLREAEEARLKKEREDKIAADAAAKAKQEAEEKAKREQDERDRAAAAEAQRLADKAAKEKADREAAEKRALEADARTKELARKAAQDAAAAEQRRKDEADAAEKKRLADVAQAKKDEAARQQKIKDDEAAAEAKRAADTAHKGKINKAALAAIMQHASLSEKQGQDVVAAIARGLVPAVKISY